MLAALDVFFHALHILVIGLNVFGWAWRRTRRAHRWLLGVTAACWLVVGPLMDSPGYCPLTDWHWQVKRARGETDLPSSYIDYLLQLAGIHADPAHIDVAVGGVFFAVCCITLALWRRERRKKFKSSGG